MPALDNALYDAWNRADHCTQLLLNCGANGAKAPTMPDAATLRRLRESVDLLVSHVDWLERIAKAAGGAA